MKLWFYSLSLSLSAPSPPHPLSLSSQVKERPDIGVYVKDLTAINATNADDLDRIMTIGNKNRECLEEKTPKKLTDLNKN